MFLFLFSSNWMELKFSGFGLTMACLLAVTIPEFQKKLAHELKQLTYAQWMVCSVAEPCAKESVLHMVSALVMCFKRASSEPSQ